jgi:rhodanese-related sulfurtransferase
MERARSTHRDRRALLSRSLAARGALLAVLVAAATLAVACGGDTTPTSPPSATMPPSSPAAASVTPSAPAYTDIGPDQLAAMLEDKDFVFVNTHVPYEGHIAQTDLFLPYDRAAELVDRLPADKDAKIVVYCRSDRMSRIAAEAWAEAGYTNLYNLAGGFVAWEQAGYMLQHQQGRE